MIHKMKSKETGAWQTVCGIRSGVVDYSHQWAAVTCEKCLTQVAINEAGSRAIRQMQDADRVNRGEEFDQ